MVEPDVMRRAGTICIVTPSALGSNPRVVKEADALAAAGYGVTVISLRTLDEVDALDDDVLGAARWRSVRLDFRSGAARRLPRALQVAALNIFRLFTSRQAARIAISPYATALTRAAKRSPADLYIAHYPGALPAAQAAAAAHDARFSFDAEDFHPGEITDPLQSRVLHSVEAETLPHCAYVTAASPGIAEAYAERYSIGAPAVLLNVFPLSEAPDGPSIAGSTKPGPSIYWVSQTIGPNRGLECAIKALAKTRTEPHLYLRGSISESFSRDLKLLSISVGLGDRIHFLPAGAPSEMAKLATKFDIGLASEPAFSQNNNIALSNKIFTYLLAGLPVILSRTSGQELFARQIADAVSVYEAENPDDLALRIDEFLSDSSRLENLRSKAYNSAQTLFNWEFESEKLVRLVERALS